MHPAFWFVNLTGSIAAFCTTLAFVPQLVRVYRLKSARDISLVMFLVFSIGESLWLLYGLFIHSMPVILANAITLGLALAILCLKLQYDRKQKIATAAEARLNSLP
ncbi:MAG TPA: SemiSWEET transporter [Acidobacteriaceae bacterium]|nr:SemiSWEET transporter [Acidobacteriaceae bacterium]